MGIVFALASLLFAGLNDFLFKRYVSRPGRPLGLFVAGIGVVWAGVFAAAMLVRGERLTMAHWPVSLGAGAASVAANLLFIASFRVFSASTSATVYRLNLIIAAVLSFAWLKEEVTPAKLAGITLGVGAVLAFWRGEALGAPETPGSTSNPRPAGGFRGRAAGVAMLAGACGLRAVMGVLYKRSTDLGVGMLEMLTLGGACWIVGGLAFAALRGESAPASFRRLASYCAVNGLLICGIVFFLLAAAKRADASVVIPITQLSFIVTCLLAVRLQGERLNRAKAAGLVFATACVVLLCWA